LGTICVDRLFAQPIHNLIDEFHDEIIVPPILPKRELNVSVIKKVISQNFYVVDLFDNPL